MVLVLDVRHKPPPSPVTKAPLDIRPYQSCLGRTKAPVENSLDSLCTMKAAMAKTQDSRKYCDIPLKNVSYQQNGNNVHYLL